MTFLMFKNCTLCLKATKLKNSHVMPQCMYKAAGRAAEPFESDLIHVDHIRGTAVRTSRQLKQKMLCDSCEGKLSRLGEDYFARICFQGAGRFELREKLHGLAPDELVSGRKMWLESNAKSVLNTTSIKYFVISILWRHSICSVGGSASQYKGMLGRTYEEQFRLYLAEGNKFPQNVQIISYIDDNAERASMISLPTCEKYSISGLPVKTHSFTVPGVRFRVFVGGNVEKLKSAILVIFYFISGAQLKRNMQGVLLWGSTTLNRKAGSRMKRKESCRNFWV